MAKNKVLVPLNQSESSKLIVPHVTRFLSAQENDLILFFVTRPPRAVGFGKPDLAPGYPRMPGDEQVRPTLHPIYESQQQDSIRAHVEAELTPITSDLREGGYAVATVVGFGKDPAEEILREIETENIDLVAMSTRARVGVTRFFFRDVADTLARKASIPMLLIHPVEG